MKYSCKYVVLLYLLCSIGVPNCFAQTASLSFKHYTVKDGLSNNHIKSVVQDDKGFIWIGTTLGLNRYDGKNFLQFYAASSNANLPGDDVNRLSYLGNHELAIATTNGAAILNTQTLQISNLFFDAPENIRYWAYNIRNILKDAGGNYCVISSTGIFVFDKNKKLINQFIPYSEADVLKGKIAFSATNSISPSGEAIALTRPPRKFIQYNFRGNNFDSTGSFIRTLYRTSTGNISRLKNEQYFLLPNEKNPGIWADYSHSPEYFSINKKANPVNAEWYSVVCMLNDSLWGINIGTKIYFATLSNGVLQFPIGYAETNIKNCEVFFTDNDQRIWIGNHTGLYKQDIRKKYIQSFAINEPVPTNILSVLVKNDKIFAGSSTNRLFEINKSTHQILRSISFSNKQPSNFEIAALFNYAADTIWAGTEQGLIWVNVKKLSSGTVNIGDGLEQSRQPYVNHIYKDTRGGYWLSTNNFSDIYYRAPAQNIFKKISVLPRRILYNNIITEDESGNIWFSGDFGVRINPRTIQPDSIITQIPLPNNYSKGFTVLFSPKKEAWINSRLHGWVVFGKEKPFRYLNSAEIIGNNKAFVDIYMGIIYGYNLKNDIVIINTKNDTVRTLTTADGHPDLPVSSLHFVLDTIENNIYYAAGNQLAYFNASYQPAIQKEAPFYITALQIINDSTIFFPDELVHLNYHQNNLRLFFSSINFYDNTEIEYYYRLEPGNSNWTKLTAPEVLLSNLAYGKYRFEIKALSPSRKWKEASKSLSIHISAPFWRTGWFIGLVSLLGILWIALFVYQQWQKSKQSRKINQLESEKKLAAVDALLQGQEEERRRLAQELHDGLGGMLSGAKISLGNLNDMLPENAKKLQNYQLSLNQLDASIAELRRVSHNLMPETLIKFQLSEALADYINGMNAAQSTVNIIFQFYGQNRELSNTVQLNIYRIFQELINNAIKHAAASQVLAQLSITDSKILITVDDNGRGFDTSTVNSYTSIGMKSIRLRVDYLKGQLNIESNPGEGTSVNIELQV